MYFCRGVGVGDVNVLDSMGGAYGAMWTKDKYAKNGM